MTRFREALGLRDCLDKEFENMPGRGVILHPTDYSEHARQAFDLACRIARSCGDRLIVMHVAEPVRSSSLGMAPVPPLPKGYRGAWESRLRLVRPHDASLPVEHRLEEGDVANAIVRVAREVPCDLIVMSGRQRTWLRERFHSSITAEVERSSPCPVLRLHPRRQVDVAENASRDSRYKAILHPTDFLQPARLSFDLARVLAAESGSELIVAHVASASALDGEKGNRDEIEAALRRMAGSDPTVRGRWMLRTGGPTTEILWMAREGWCDMIVMGTRNCSGLGRVFGRNIAAQVRWNSPCPVATVKLPHDWSAVRQWRRKGDVPSNRDRLERQDEPGPSGPDRAASATPAEWMSARLSPKTGERRPSPAGPLPHLLCQATRATSGHGRDGPPDLAE